MRSRSARFTGLAGELPVRVRDRDADGTVLVEPDLDRIDAQITAHADGIALSAILVIYLASVGLLSGGDNLLATACAIGAFFCLVPRRADPQLSAIAAAIVFAISTFHFYLVIHDLRDRRPQPHRAGQGRDLRERHGSHRRHPPAV